MVATTQAVRTTLDDGDRSIKPRWRANLRRALDRADSASALVAELIRGDLPDDVRDWLGPRITVGRWPGWAQMTVVLAWGLERRLWSPPDTGGVKVAFLGASSLEASGCHDVEGALSELLGLDVQVDLVGPRLEGLSGPSGPDRRIYEERGTPRGFAMPVEACWRAGVLEKPDVAVMMHPGVVVSEDFWLCDEGLKTWVQGGVPVLVTAFTDEEAERDAELLESAGYVVGDLVQNVFGEEFVEKDDCIGGSTFWAAVLYPILGVDSERWSRRKVEVDDVGIDKSTEIRSLPLDVRRLASAVLRSNGNMGVTRRLVAPEQTSARQYRRADVAHGLLAAKRRAATSQPLVVDSRGGCSPAARHGPGIRHELASDAASGRIGRADPAHRARLGRRLQLDARSRPEISPCGAPFGHEPETAIDHGALGGREGIRCAVRRLCDAP